MKVDPMKMKPLVSTAILSSALGMFFASNAAAQSLWTGGTGDYSTAGNWTPSGVPSSGTAIEINSGEATFSGSDALYERAATTTIDGGTLVLDNARFLNGRPGPATFNMKSGSLTQNGTYFIVAQSDAGTFNQSGGTVNLDLRRGFFTTDGAAGSNTGTYSLTGGTLDVSLNGLESNNDAHNFQMGRSTAGADLFHVDGGTFNLRNSGTLGTTDKRAYIFRDSTFRVDSGIVDVAGMTFFTVGRGVNAGRTANFLVNGGDSDIAVTNAFIVGGGQDGYMQMTDGTLDILQSNNGGGNFWIGDTSTTASAVVEQSGGDITVAGELLLARSANNNARYTMSGGTLSAEGIDVVNGTGLFEFNGGTITLDGDQTSLLSEAWFDAAPGAFADFDGTSTTLAIPEPAMASALAALLALGAAAMRRRPRV